jgi:hypothetical protein
MYRINTLCVLAPAFILVAAGPAPLSRVDPGFGLVTDGNIAAQTVDMRPEYAGVPIEGASGQRSADAYRRYQTGNVKKLYKTTGESAVGQQGGAVEQVVTTPNN